MNYSDNYVNERDIDQQKKRKLSSPLLLLLLGSAGLYFLTKSNDDGTKVKYLVENSHMDFIYQLIDKYGQDFSLDKLSEDELAVYNKHTELYDELRKIINDFSSSHMDADLIIDIEATNSSAGQGFSYILKDSYKDVIHPDVSQYIEFSDRSRKIDTSNQSDVNDLNTYINAHTVPGILFGYRSHAVYNVGSIINIPSMTGTIVRENSSLGIVSEGHKVFVEFALDEVDVKYVISDSDRIIQDIWYDGTFYYYGQSTVVRGGRDTITLHSSNIRNGVNVTGWLQKFESKGKRKYKFFGKRTTDITYKSRYMFTPNKLSKVGFVIHFQTGGRAGIFRRVL